MVSEERASLSRRSALKMAGGAAVLAAGAAVLAACGSGGAGNSGTTTGSGSAGGTSTAAKTGTTSTAASGGFKVTGGTGKVTVSGNKATLLMRGDDIWNSADTFTYFDTPFTNAKATWTVKVDSLDSTDPWAKAGIMARKSLDPGSAHVFIAVTIGNGITLQHRDADGTSEAGNDSLADASTGAAPVWLKLSTDGKGNWTADYSTDGKTWATGGTAASTNPIDLGSKYLLGLATTSHNAAVHGNAVFEAWVGPALGSADAVGTNDTA